MPVDHRSRGQTSHTVFAQRRQSTSNASPLRVSNRSAARPSGPPPLRAKSTVPLPTRPPPARFRRRPANDRPARIRQHAKTRPAPARPCASFAANPWFSRWSKNNPVFCPPIRSAMISRPIHRHRHRRIRRSSRAQPRARLPALQEPSPARSAFLMTHVNTCHRLNRSASVNSGINTPSAQAALGCTTAVSPNRSITTPGNPSASACTSR